MDETRKETRYTLALPKVIYDEITGLADRQNVTVKDMVRQILKFGLIAIKLNEDPNKQIIIRENTIGANGESVHRDTELRFIW